LLYLTDDDLVDLFKSCKKGLKEGGLIIVKENICTSGFIVDREDNSLTRSHAYWMGLFARANVSVVMSMKQKDMPEQLYQVKMYVLRPKSS
jgi:protein N-terminal methyltransferase